MRMIDWRLGLLAAAAALSLQACDVQVHSSADNTKVQQPQASLPDNARLDGQQTAAVTPPPVDTTAAPAPDAAASAALPVPDTTAQAPTQPDMTAQAPAQPDATAQVPAQPDTSALGAPGATPAASTATTSAAPTELQRFFETNSPAAKAEKAAAKK
ncbi:hypothetical protein LZ009_20070 [Ramlibacter sp. XY19]|uniref:hypothetical protein n=1 Tax=Ramlibacter paludis TaxID=2908000 RepID=UPI0023DB5E6D|nr:hypothetical protein [Ramlibacter paludis]MCG2595082.1 hypothetical protein [Ramlibacter paludis]